MDIGGFYLKNGTYLSVEDDWEDPTKGAIIKSIKDEFCKSYDVVLSPDYNDAHKDHLHIDLDPDLREEFEDIEPTWGSLPPKSEEKIVANRSLRLEHYSSLSQYTKNNIDDIFSRMVLAESSEVKGFCR